MASTSTTAPNAAPQGPPPLPIGQELPTIQNVVATCSLQVSLDLAALYKKLKNAEYNPRRFKAVIVRDRNPKATALIFHTGNMVCTGTKSMEDAEMASKKFAKAVQQALAKKVKFKDFKIQNVVGVGNVNFPIRLEGIKMAHGEFANYEPELFPGLIYRLELPKVWLGPMRGTDGASAGHGALPPLAFDL